MNIYVVGFFALLIVASCLAAYYKQRQAFLLIFSLTLASGLVGILGGVDALETVAWLLVGVGVAAGLSYAFREFLVALLPMSWLFV